MVQTTLLWVLFSFLIVWAVTFLVLALRGTDSMKPEQEAISEAMTVVYKSPMPKAVHTRQSSLSVIAHSDTGDMETASA